MNAALLYFDVSFMAWILLGPLAPFLRGDQLLRRGAESELFGAVLDATGSYARGLLGCGAVFLVGTLVLLELGTRWSQRWDSGVERTGLYSYRGALIDADDESVA